MTKATATVEKLILYIFVFCIPFQARLVLARWTVPFNEWTAGFLWGTDTVLGALFALWLVRAIREKQKPRLDHAGWFMAAFVAIAVFSVSVARIPAISWFRLFKLAEFIGLFFYLRTSQDRRLYEWDTVIVMVVLSGIFQAVIGIAQSLVQSSLGLKWLGESVLHVGSQGVAVFDVGGKLFLRAYGTLPHPNLLATWLLLAMWSAYALWISRGRRWMLGIYAIILFGFLLTFSRVPIFVWGITIVVGFVVMRAQWRKLLPLLWTTLVVCALFAAVYWPQLQARGTLSGDDEAIIQRSFYNGIARDVTKHHPVLGIGIGQFVPELMHRLRYYPAHIYQPAHNIYYLIATELGILGLIAFLCFFVSRIYPALQSWRTRWPILLIVAGFLFMGLFDHYFWTLQQGGLMFWGILGLL